MFKSIFTDELGLDFPKTLPFLKEWGLNACDLRARIFQKSLESLSDEELLQVRQLVRENGFRIGCLQSSLGKVHLPGKERYEEEMRKLDRIIRAAELLDCRLVRSFFFWQPPNGQQESVGELAVRPDVLAQVMELFLPFAEKAKRAGLRLAFENCGCTKEECFTMLDALEVPGWGFAWDPKNTWMSDKPERDRDFDGYLTRLAKRAIAVHVKSIGTISDDGGRAEFIPYEKIFRKLTEVGFNGPVSIETHNFDRSISNAEACRRVLEVVNRAWPAAAAGAQQESCSVSAATVVRSYAADPVRFGVVGLGMGHNRAGEMMKTPGIRLVQLCDRQEERCRRSSEAYHVPATRDFAEMLANPEVEAVMVMNETGRHGELALQALEAGKHVLLTKPMEMRLEQCDRMIALARERKLLLGLDHCRRLRPSVQSLKAAQEAGFFGRPLSVSVTLKVNRTMEYFRENGGWRGTRALDGGVLSNQTIHHLDEVLYVFGMPEAVRCDTWTQTHEIEMEDLGLAVWRYPDGMIVNICATTSYPQPSWYYQMELHGTEGAYIHREGGPAGAPVTLYFRDGAWSETAPFPRECPWLNSMDGFASALRCGTAQLTTPEEGRNAVRIIQAMYESARGKEGAWVRL